MTRSPLVENTLVEKENARWIPAGVLNLLLNFAVLITDQEALVVRPLPS
jgi:hypothetical protein